MSSSAEPVTRSSCKRTSSDLSTVLVAPTSTSARRTTFRPTIALEGEETYVPVEQATVSIRSASVDRPGRLEAGELRAVDDALMLVLGL